MSQSPSSSSTPPASASVGETGTPTNGLSLPHSSQVDAETLSLRAKNRRERNKLASRKCRALKSARLVYLDGRVAELEEEVRVLRAALGTSANSIPSAIEPELPTPNLTPQSSLSSISSSSTRSLASLKSSSLASITSTSSMETIPDVEIDDDKDTSIADLKRENEALKACMAKFEQEWNAAVTTLGLKGTPINGKQSATTVSAIDDPKAYTATENAPTDSESSPPAHSLATLIAAATQLTSHSS
ncbi:hypothetical protein EV361DRAFT_871675 [Lentinula raphanica]|uniref:BZIP domain-containing protein n=1 Tax=Lentinula raphanica TaxID=153919 RepID=A0AA38NZE4_9AGAR|nr:hypothetical protein C8R42DRAFT_773562 [Lentinula raphanica]KAJ3761956.1 hypothetical protein EV360DRAFT_67436 [Lentinula raphanica]KAJ3773005.1 hypothetical protein FB446DRAFT_734558 [Lentinula raphanica]KAJ3824156.1 hypothetical protein F5880DRAFT_1612260 [Lentinula raphanica]KAJ3833248.1 hypothetical protein F5878DRAFT_728922 [Lentinula raphanica]